MYKYKFNCILWIRREQEILVKCKHKYKLQLELHYLQGRKYKYKYKLHVLGRRQVQSSDPGAVTSLLPPPFLSQQLKLIYEAYMPVYEASMSAREVTMPADGAYMPAY